MFGRSKTTDETVHDEATRPERDGAKNRPTPKRRDQEAARKQPLVVTDRKAAKSKDRQKRQQAYALQRQAMLTGDDKNLPARDKGPVKRFIRDYVDARWSLGEFLLPGMLIILALMFIKTAWAMNFVFLGTYSLIILAVLDAYLLWRRIKKAIYAKFGPDTPLRGQAMYAIMRAFQMRRTRMPRPQVARGEFPR